MAKQREAASNDLGDFLAAHRGLTPVRQAAKLTDGAVSEGRWRQIEAGYESKGGHKLPVNPKPNTVAAMARAVHADVATALRLAGHDPARHPDLLRDPEPEVSLIQRVRDAEVEPRIKRVILELLDAEPDPERTHGRETGT